MAKKLKKNKTWSKLTIILGAVILILLVWSNLFELKINPNKRFLALVNKFKPTPSVKPSLAVDFLSNQVAPKKGYTIKLVWGDVGRKLVEAGGVDLEKYRQNYKDKIYQDLLTYLTEEKKGGITINSQNAYFWVNTLWALGLTQKSDVLDKGIMGTEYKNDIGNFASAGGWTLGAKYAVSLYSSAEIIPLTADQQKLVDKISQG